MWEGCFVRFDRRGLELERFDSRLQVEDQAGTVVAALTNLSSGQVRTMDFQEPPAEMQISQEGHWSLGPDRIGPWPWVSELCLVWGHRRRRAVIRHGSDQLDSVVLVSEARPNHQEPLAPAPLQALIADTSGSNNISSSDSLTTSNALIWTLPTCLAVTVQTVAKRGQGMAEEVVLRWQPEPQVSLEIRRRYSLHGLLERGSGLLG
jgi:hypothetical protein